MQPRSFSSIKKSFSQLRANVKSGSLELPSEQIFAFSRAENFSEIPGANNNPLLQIPEPALIKKVQILPRRAFEILTHKFQTLSSRFITRNLEKPRKKNERVVFPEPRKRAVSSILDIKAAKSLSKGSQGGGFSLTVKTQKKSNHHLDLERRSSLSVFEDFTGRKVSEMEYYADSPRFSPQRKQELFYANKKIDRIQRLQLHGRKIKYPFLILPFKSPFKFWWDMFITLLIFLNSLLNPLEIAFQQQSNAIYQGFNFTVIVFYLMDILLSMRTSFYDENNDEIIDGILLFKNYVKSKSFLIDFLSAIPWSEIIEYGLQGTSKITYVKFVNLLKFIRLLRLSRIFFYFKNDSYKILFQITRITLIFVITFHWATCLWIFLVSLQFQDLEENFDYNTWLPINYRGIVSSVVPPTPSHFSEKYYDTDQMSSRYYYSLYSILLMVIGSEMGTVGILQTLFAVLICIIGSFFYAIFFSEVMLLISKLNYAYSLYQTKLDELDTKLEKNNIPLTIRDKIHEYYQFYWKKQKIFQNLSDFSKLSESLKREILFYTHKDIVVNVPLFHELEAVEILRIIQKLKTQIYLPQDYIIHEGEKGTEMYFLTEGLAEILIRKEDKILSILLRKGAYFGEIALITNSSRTSDVRAIDFCILEVFTKDDYEQLKLEYPDITGRLTDGLKHYKKNHLENILNVLEKNELFKEIEKKDLIEISMNYMNEIFLDAQELLLKPKKRTNALYFLLLGKMEIYSNTEESRSFIRDRINRRKKPKRSLNESRDDLSYFPCLDDELGDFPHLFQDDCRLVLNKVGSLVVGDMIGGITFEKNRPKSGFYYFAESACHFCLLTQASFEQLRLDRIDLYLKITDNFNKYKAQYQKIVYNEVKTFFTSSSVISNSSPLTLSTSTIPKDLQPHINLQKAKKAIFFDEFDQRQPKTSNKIGTYNMFTSMVENFESWQSELIEEEKGANPMARNSKYIHNPIEEENSSENSDRSERDFEPEGASIMPSYITFGDRKKTINQPLFTFNENNFEKKPEIDEKSMNIEESEQKLMMKSDESYQKHNGDKRESSKKGVSEQLRRLQELEKRLDRVLSAENLNIQLNKL